MKLSVLKPVLSKIAFHKHALNRQYTTYCVYVIIIFTCGTTYVFCSEDVKW